MFGRAEMIIKVARRCCTLSLSLYETVNHRLIMTCSIVLLVCHILREFKLCLIYQFNNHILSWIFAQSNTRLVIIKFMWVNLLCHATVIQSTLLCSLLNSFVFFLLFFTVTHCKSMLYVHTLSIPKTTQSNLD